MTTMSLFAVVLGSFYGAWEITRAIRLKDQLLALQDEFRMLRQTRVEVGWELAGYLYVHLGECDPLVKDFMAALNQVEGLDEYSWHLLVQVDHRLSDSCELLIKKAKQMDVLDDSEYSEKVLVFAQLTLQLYAVCVHMNELRKVRQRRLFK